MNYTIILAKIADIDPGEVFQYCPFCKRPTTIAVEISGPLRNWHQCDECRYWFHPGIKFQGENDDVTKSGV